MASLTSLGSPRVQRMARVGLILAGLFAFVMAALPHPPRVPGEPSDKILHMVAFATLGTLAGLGFHARSIAFLLAALAMFGGAIEIVQAIPMLNRDSELADWLADIAAAYAALASTRWLMNRHEREAVQQGEP